MSKAERISEVLRLYQWKTDLAECEPLNVGPHSSILVEVRGDLGGHSVVFLGGLTPGEPDELAFLDEVNQAGVITLPPVNYLLPVTDAIGITITIRGLA